MSGNSPRSSPSPSIRANPSPNSPSSGQENAATERSLQEASVALEVAYNRIRQVRRSLLQLSETLPISESTTSRSNTDHNEIGPGHEALLLSGGEREERNEPEVRRAWTPPIRSMPPSPTQQTGDTSNLLLPAQSLSSTINPSEQPTLFQLRQNAGPPTRPPRLRTRREVSPSDMRFFSRRASSPDSASTTRGLRVAAREVHSQDSNVDFLAHAAEFDRLLARQRERMADSANALATFRAQRTERQNRLQRTAETQNTQRTVSASTVPPHPTVSATPWRSPDPRRWRIRPDLRQQNSRQSSIEITGQIETLSSMPNQPSSFSNPPRSSWSTERRSAFAPSGRSLNSNQAQTLFSEDMSSNINIDWSDEEFISWLFPDQDNHLLPPRDFATRLPTDRSTNADAIRVTRTTDTTVSPLENSPPTSRRGWARLDPDGNEIPPNEEEELERSRTEYRLGALQQTRQNTAGQASTLGELFQHNGQRTMFGSVLDSTLHVPEGRQRFMATYGNDSTCLYVDPLPMPLAAMVIDSETFQQNGIGVDVVVPQHACLAGR